VVGTNSKLLSKDIELILRLQNLEIKKQRLEEFIVKTQQITEKVKQGASVTNMDIDQMRGCLGSWPDDKKQSYQDEQHRLEYERSKGEEEHMKLNEEEEIKREEKEIQRKENTKNEEVERRKQEVEKLLKREKEERMKLQEEERRCNKEDIKKEGRMEMDIYIVKGRNRWDEEERKMEEKERLVREKEVRKIKEVEDRRRKEEHDWINKCKEERFKREEKKRKFKEEEDKRMKEDEDRINKETERKKREDKERKKREMQKKEEEERRMNDPANWTPHTKSDEESGKLHSDICCNVLALPKSLQEEDLECMASDEWLDKEGPTLVIGEQLASFLTEVKVKEDDKDLKVPMRIYVPHCSVSDSSDEVIIKASIDGGEWTNMHPVTVPSRQTTSQMIRDLNCAAIDVAKFHTVKVLAVAKTRSEELVVDKNGIRKTSTLDKNIKLFVPRDTFRKPQKIKLEIRPIRDNSLTFATQYYDHCHNVLSTSSVMAITCEAPTEKSIELDLTRNAPKDKTKRDKGKYLHIYKCKGDNWKIADSKVKGKNMDVSINLPSRKNVYMVMEIEGRVGIPNEEFIKAADELYFHSNALIVRVVAKQREDNPHIIMIQCIRREHVSSRLSELESNGYSLGPDTSKEFPLIDGQVISLRCSGNITMKPESEVKIIFHAYMDTAKIEVLLEAVEGYKHKDVQCYDGYLQFEILQDNREGVLNIKTSGSLPITLPTVHI
ncbi:hypothetical protein ACJMK2_003040, partial [Sinanodonta woodiana]